MYSILIFSSGMRYTEVFLKRHTKTWLKIELWRGITGWVGEVVEMYCGCAKVNTEIRKDLG